MPEWMLRPNAEPIRAIDSALDEISRLNTIIKSQQQELDLYREREHVDA
jgi:hypothetical protein